MKGKADFISKDELRKRALAEGLPRGSAWTLAIIAFFSQMNGGVSIGVGPKWQWREYIEMAEETGFSVKSIGRAVADLKSQKLIEVKRIFHPQKPGRNVNAFRVTHLARSKLQLPWPSGPVQTAQAVALEKDTLAAPNATLAPDQTPQHGASKYNQQTEEISENTATHSHVGEGADVQFIEENFGKKFQEGSSWNSIDEDAVYEFWTGYKRLIKEQFSKTVGVYNGKRREWIEQYLKVFQENDRSPKIAVIAFVIAISNWAEFSAMLAAHEGKPSFITKDYPDPYSLGVYGHVFLDYAINEFGLED